MKFRSNLSHCDAQATCDSKYIDIVGVNPLSHVSHGFCQTIYIILLLSVFISFLSYLYIFNVTNYINNYILIY